MKNLVGLKSGIGDCTYEVLGCKDALIHLNPPFNAPIDVPGYHLKVSGNAVSAESDIRDRLGDEYHVIASGPSLVEIYSDADYLDAVAKSPVRDGIMVNAVWYVANMPTAAVVELPDNSLVYFNITPFRMLSDKDFRPYNGYHPRKCKGQPLPDYLYRFYGLVKNTESATEVIHIRLTPTEKAKVETSAVNEDKTTSEFVREWIRSL